MDNFPQSLSLAGDDLEDTKAKLKSEGVSFQQLVTVINDDELEEIGISAAVRQAIQRGVQKYQEEAVRCPLMITIHVLCRFSYTLFRMNSDSSLKLKAFVA